MSFSRSARWSSALVLAAMLLSLLALSGCATGPKIVSAWQDPAYQGKGFDDILVVGVTAHPGRQRIFEDAFTKHLEASGVRARPSFQFMNPADQATEEEITAIVQEHNIDAIFVTRVVGQDQKTTYTPGYTTVMPGPGYYGSFYGYYSYSYGYYHSPGYVSTYQIVSLETNLYDAADGTLVWTGMSETVDPSSVEREASQLADVILDEMAGRGLLLMQK